MCYTGTAKPSKVARGREPLAPTGAVGILLGSIGAFPIVEKLSIPFQYERKC
jgi:hypothetical protein